MGKWIHRLSEIDEVNHKAICAGCGVVEVFRKDGRWKCRKAERVRDRARNRKSRHHGLTSQEARELKDGASCAICGSSESLKVDHCHVTGKIRGVLCHHCNVAIGHMRDSPDRLRTAALYLEA